MISRADCIIKSNSLVNGEYRLLIIDEPGTFMQTNNLPILSELIGPVRDKEAAESLVFVEAAP